LRDVLEQVAVVPDLSARPKLAEFLSAANVP